MHKVPKNILSIIYPIANNVTLAFISSIENSGEQRIV